MDKNEVLTKLHNLCNRNNFSQYRLSKESGVPLTTISSMFRNNSYPSIPTLNKLCSAFNITISDFFINETLPFKLTEEDAVLINIYNSLTPLQKKYLSSYISGLRSQ